MSAKSRRIMAKLRDRDYRKRVSEALNKDTMDAAAPLGNGEMTILRDMESLDQEHVQYMQDLKGGGRSEGQTGWHRAARRGPHV